MSRIASHDGMSLSSGPVPTPVGEKADLLRSSLGLDVESAMYFVCLEALQNARKHAGPDAVISVSLHSGDEGTSLAVEDDGPGFESTAVRDGAGLQNMEIGSARWAAPSP